MKSVKTVGQVRFRKGITQWKGQRNGKFEEQLKSGLMGNALSEMEGQKGKQREGEG